jgi:16S rRNA (cytosine967-C5)-methyltransferase
MPVSPARAAAFEILLRVARDQSYTSELLHSARVSKLSTADHKLATELVMGVLRWRSWIDERIAEASSQRIARLDQEVLAALRLGVYQLEFLTRVPARAAIFESAEIVKAARKTSAVSFVNAVLRKIAGKAVNRLSAGSAGADALAEIVSSPNATTLARNAAHPEWLVRSWVERFELEAARKICAYNQQPPATALHIYDDECLTELSHEGITLAPGRLISAARIVRSGDVTRTPAYRERHIAIQDEGAQLVALLVGRGTSILDCCAAPGGKTLLIANRNPAATVFAAELHPHRARLLCKLVRLPNVRILAADATQLPFSLAFDRLLADVPCSGTGTLARNPEIKWSLRSEDLRDLQSRQTAILKAALARLSEEGRLVYSTCSLEREENQEVVEAVLCEYPEFTLVECRHELERLQNSGELSVDKIETLLDGPYLRTIPGIHACDGFFAAIIERR